MGVDERPTGDSSASVEERLRAVLVRVAPNARVVHYSVPTETAEAAAAAAGCSVSQIVKSLLFMADGGPVLVLVAGDRRADLARLAPLLGLPRKRIRMATRAEVRDATGCDVGSVPPFAHPAPIETIVDSALQSESIVYASAGSSDSLFGISVDQLLRATGARAACVGIDVRPQA